MNRSFARLKPAVPFITLLLGSALPLLAANWHPGLERSRETGIFERTGSRSALADPKKPSQEAPVASMHHPLRGLSQEIEADDLMRHVKILASEKMEGRLTGSAGEQLATRYVADAFSALALEPAGEGGSYFQRFPFTSGADFGPQSHLEAAGQTFTLGQDWQPLPISSSGSLQQVEGVFAGFGIRAPALKDGAAFDAYSGLDVTGRFVLILEGLPEPLTPEERQHLEPFSGLRQKVAVARDRGAVGMVVVCATSKLSSLSSDASFGAVGIPVLAVTADVGATLVSASGNDLSAWRKQLERRAPIPAPNLKGIALSATLDVIPRIGEGRNVLGRLLLGTTPTPEVVVVGAHIDHLGRGETGDVHAESVGKIHYGADDNASGVAGMLEIAQHITYLLRHGDLKLERDVVFAAWSGEEIGLLGSSWYVNHFPGKEGRAPLRPEVAAYLNLDMIGRSTGQVVMFGMASSPDWKGLVEPLIASAGIAVSPRDDTFMPTDATAFYLRGVPVLSFFTGAHLDYNTPSDTYEKLNYPAASQVAKLGEAIVLKLMETKTPPAWQASSGGGAERRGGRRIALGTVPDFAASNVTGLKLSGVTPGGPAAIAGVAAGDVIVSLAGRPISNIQDFMAIMESLTIGQPVPIIVEREGNKLELSITPIARQ